MIASQIDTLATELDALVASASRVFSGLQAASADPSLARWYPGTVKKLKPGPGPEDAPLALVHYDGWNMRYDHWVSTSSDLLQLRGARDRHREALAAAE